VEKKKIVFLYSELANYFLACVEKLIQIADLEVHIVRWPINKEAPFNFNFSKDIIIHDIEQYSEYNKLQELIIGINPSLIFCSGWVDKGYLKICRKFKKQIPVIVGIDNHWKASVRQFIATLISPFRILNHFTHCWVPGQLQYDYAKRLGFKSQNILTGFYSCDYDFFNQEYNLNRKQKADSFPHRFIFVGRYVESKGIQDLWSAFIEVQEEKENNWELWCLGTGDIPLIQHPKIKHFGFIQPNQLTEYLKLTGVFVLPSHFEPWGVVIHEFASAGFPIICSDKVGARVDFVEDNYNGYVYPSGNIVELKNTLRNMMNKSNDELNLMGERSTVLAKKITPEVWSTKLLDVLNQYKY